MNKIASVLSTMVSTLFFSVPALADAGFYGELSLGLTQNSGKLSTFSTIANTNGALLAEPIAETVNLSGDSMSAAIKLGYQFGQYFAVELGHNKYGNLDGFDIDEFGDAVIDKIESSSSTVGIKGLLPLFDDFSVFARLGIANWDFEASSTNSSLPNELVLIKGDGNDIYYGVGAEYRINETFSIGIEYSVIDMGLSETVSENYKYLSYSGTTTVDYKVESISLSFKMSY